MSCLYYYKLQSEFPCDVSKQCKLTINEIDSNFYQLKKDDISAATYVRDEDSKGTLVLVRNNGDKIIVPIDTTIDKNLTYDFNASSEVGADKGTTLTITWKDDEGVEKSTKIENIITSDNLIDVLGSDVLTKVITDSSLKGLGTMRSPLGISGVEKTGMLAPAIKVIDLTDGGELGVAKKGTRYITKEYVSDYGYLYNGDGVNKIQGILDNEYQDKEIYKEVSDRKYYWRVPSKGDWDKLLNSLEPCDYKNHGSASCHKELGKLAGKYLKSECGWSNSLYECSCEGKKPYVCSSNDSAPTTENVDDYVFDNTDVIPSDALINPVGVDKFGMTIYPTGTASISRHGIPQYFGFKEMTIFWTSTHINDDVEQDIYLKQFDDTRSGVYQFAECPKPYCSVRLVKDYDGSNYKDTEYIDGIPYRTMLFPETKQIWLVSNFAGKKGFITLDNVGEVPEVLVPNDGQGIDDKRIEMYINEYNGFYWEKKVMNEGDTIVVEKPCLPPTSSTTKTVCWVEDKEEICVTIEVQTVSQENLEYRVYYTEDGCDKELKDTDDIILERLLKIFMPVLYKEKIEREDADEFLQDQINELSSAVTSGMSALSEALDEEIARAISAETELDGKIDQEISDREAADTEIWNAIEELASATTSAITELREDLDEEITERKLEDAKISGAIETEIARAIEAEEALHDDIVAEEARAISAETELNDKLDDEIARAKATENEISGLTINSDIEYTLSASASTENLILESKDGNENHFVKIKFDGNFGTINF